MSAVKPYYDHDGITIYHGDCREVMPSLSEVDLVLTDPPYGIPAGSAFWRRNGTAIEDDRDETHNVEVEGWREGAALRISVGYACEFGRGHPEAVTALVAAWGALGFVPWHFYVLLKAAPAPTPRPTFASSWETALISYRGERKWYGSGYVPNSWIGMTPNRLGVGVHPTQKPLDPFCSLVGALSPENGLVLDPFMGSGTTLRAAKDLGRRAIGIEIEERYCEIAANRLMQQVLL